MADRVRIVLLCESTREWTYGTVRCGHSGQAEGPAGVLGAVRMVYNSRAFDRHGTPHYHSGQLHINVLAAGSAPVPATETTVFK